MCTVPLESIMQLAYMLCAQLVIVPNPNPNSTMHYPCARLAVNIDTAITTSNQIATHWTHGQTG